MKRRWRTGDGNEKKKKKKKKTQRRNDKEENALEKKTSYSQFSLHR